MTARGVDQYVDEQMMAQLASRIGSLVPVMQRQLKQLDSEMQALFGTWKGRSSSSFQRLHANWAGDYAKLSQALDGISRSVLQSQRNTTGADEASQIR